MPVERDNNMLRDKFNGMLNSAKSPNDISHELTTPEYDQQKAGKDVQRQKNEDIDRRNRYLFGEGIGN